MCAARLAPYSGWNVFFVYLVASFCFAHPGDLGDGFRNKTLRKHTSILFNYLLFELLIKIPI